MRTGLPDRRLATLEQGDTVDALPHDEPPPPAPPAFGTSSSWVRVRTATPATEPGARDHGEHHLVQLWSAPEAPAHPNLTEEDRRRLRAGRGISVRTGLPDGRLATLEQGDTVDALPHDEPPPPAPPAFGTSSSWVRVRTATPATPNPSQATTARAS